MTICKKNISSKLIIDLTSPQGNTFVLLGFARNLASQLNLDFNTISTEMTAGDYENLITVFDFYFGDYVILER